MKKKLFVSVLSELRKWNRGQFKSVLSREVGTNSADYDSAEDFPSYVTDKDGKIDAHVCLVNMFLPGIRDKDTLEDICNSLKRTIGIMNYMSAEVVLYNEAGDMVDQDRSSYAYEDLGEELYALHKAGYYMIGCDEIKNPR